MWYNSRTLRSSSKTLQKGNTRYFQLPRYMNPVYPPQERSGSNNRAMPTMLSECSSALHTFSDPNVFVDFALDSILAIVDASSGSFFVWDEYTKELALRAACGPGCDRIQGIAIKLREGVAGWVAEKGVPVLVQDIRTDDRFLEVKKNHQYHSHSFLSLPLIVSNKLIGLINITERENHEPFNEEDLKRVQPYANHIAVAYENIRTELRLRKENQELQKAVTDLKETMKQQEPLVSLGKLASHITHELANPLDAIRRFVNLSLDQVAQDGLAREYLLKAKQGIRRSVQVIRGLRELLTTNSRLKQPRQAELHSIIEQTLTSIFQEPSFENIAIEKQFCNTSLLVEDCGLQTVFQNLLHNAHHAMNGSGTIAIVTRIEGGQAIIIVRDSGCGVPEEAKARIFEPFFTTKENGQGTGIGLTICREIIQRCGGQICFESSENEGAKFIISLPCENQN